MVVAKTNLIVTARMSDGTIQAKLEPLSRLETIENIYFLRKSEGPSISKVKYVLLPSLCKIAIFNILLTPLLLVFYTKKYKASYILSYHIIPYAFIAAIGSFFTGKPYFVGQTGLSIQSFSENKLLWFFLKRIIIRAENLCVPGTASLDFWKLKGIPESKIKLLHSTVDTDKFYPAPSKDKIYDFIYIGRISWEKRLDFLIDAFSLVCSHHPESRLVILGDGPLLDEIKLHTKAINLSGNIVFAGFQTDVIPWLSKSKFIVLTSLSEGLPCAIMEGMSAGLIPITTKVGNLPDIIINGKTGFCVDKDDLNNFAERMCYLISAKQNEIDTLQRNARTIIIERHSHSNSIENWKTTLGIK